jgi:hypothetical protein
MEKSGIAISLLEMDHRYRKTQLRKIKDNGHGSGRTAF